MFYEMDISNLCIRTYKEDHLYTSFSEILLESLKMVPGNSICCNNGKGEGVEIPSLISIVMGKKYVIKQHCVYCCLEQNFCFEDHEREIDRL